MNDNNNLNGIGKPPEDNSKPPSYMDFIKKQIAKDMGYYDIGKPKEKKKRVATTGKQGKHGRQGKTIKTGIAPVSKDSYNRLFDLWGQPVKEEGVLRGIHSIPIKKRVEMFFDNIASLIYNEKAILTNEEYNILLDSISATNRGVEYYNKIKKAVTHLQFILRDRNKSIKTVYSYKGNIEKLRVTYIHAYILFYATKKNGLGENVRDNLFNILKEANTDYITALRKFKTQSEKIDEIIIENRLKTYGKFTQRDVHKIIQMHESLSIYPFADEGEQYVYKAQFRTPEGEPIINSLEFDKLQIPPEINELIFLMPKYDSLLIEFGERMLLEDILKLLM